MDVYIVRHGESEANLAGVHSSLETKLSPEGVKQASYVADRFTRIDVDKVIASTYKIP